MGRVYYIVITTTTVGLGDYTQSCNSYTEAVEILCWISCGLGMVTAMLTTASNLLDEKMSDMSVNVTQLQQRARFNTDAMLRCHTKNLNQLLLDMRCTMIPRLLIVVVRYWIRNTKESKEKIMTKTSVGCDVHDVTLSVEPQH